MSQNIYMIVSAILLAALLLYWEVLDYMDRKVRRLQADESGKTKISGFLTALINLSDKSIRKLLLDPSSRPYLALHSPSPLCGFWIRLAKSMSLTTCTSPF